MKMKWFCLSLFLLFNNYCFREINGYFLINIETKINNDQINSCVTKLLSSLPQKLHKDIALFKINDELSKELHKLKRFKYYYYTTPHKVNNENSLPDGYIIMKKENESLERTIDNVKSNGFWNPKGTFIIITEEKVMAEENVTEILIKSNIFNVGIITKSNKTPELYAFSPELDACNRPKDLILICNCSDPKNIRIPKTEISSNLSGCVVNILTHNVSKPRGHLPILRVELRFVNIVSEYSGIKVNFKLNTVSDKVLPNFTYNRMFDYMRTGEVEALIGLFSLSEEKYKAFDSLYPYFIDKIWVVMPHRPLFTTLEAVYLQLGFENLLLTLFFYSIYCFLAILLSLFDRSARDIFGDLLTVFGYFTNNIPRMRINKAAAKRLIIVNMLVYVMIMNCVFQAAVLSVTSHRFGPKAITDVATAVKTFQPIVQADILRFITIKMKSPQFCSSFLKCMLKLKEQKDVYLCTFVPGSTYNYLSSEVQGEGYHKLYRSKEAISLLLQTMFFRRGSSLLPVFDKVASRLKSGGILEHILNRIDDDEKLHKLYHGKHNTMDIDPRGVAKLIEAFYVLCGGYVISTLVFALELLWEKIVKLYVRRKNKSNNV